MAALRRQWPLVSVLAGIVLAMVFVALDRFRVGSVLLAISVWAAGAPRRAPSGARAGRLAARRRSIDLVVLGVLGLGLAVLSVWVPPPQ